MALIELLTIGDELLLGTTVDTNAAFLGERLAAAGFRVVRHTTVGDQPEAIRQAVREALERSRCVICTGGLGPTPDDLTRPAVAAVYGWELRLDGDWLAVLEERFRLRGLRMPESNRQQAMVPAGATLLPNRRGTAPALAFSDPQLGIAVLLPGVPAELQALVDEQLLPYLAGQLGAQQPVRTLTLRTTGLAESALAERLSDVLADLPELALAYLPTGIGIDLRLTSWGVLDAARAEQALAAGERRVRARVGELVYGTGHEDLAAVVGDRLRAHGLMLAVAESCTGGLLAGRITAVPGSSDYFVGGVVAYANEIKRELAGVRADTLAERGAVSEAVALELATGATRATGADCGLGVTGVAGPGGGTAEKPVGTVWIAADVGGSAAAVLHRFSGTRDEIRARATQAALALLWRRLA